MRLLKLLVLCLAIGILGCGGSDQADQPPPGVEPDTSELDIDIGDVGVEESTTDAGDAGQGDDEEGDPPTAGSGDRDSE